MAFIPGKSRVEYGGALIGKRERNAVIKVLDSHGGKRWTIGPESEALEKELAETTGVKRAVLTNSGSSALLVALTSLHLPKGSNVIIPALNFPTAYNAILQCGLNPLVVDCNRETMNIDVYAVEKAMMQEGAEAVIAVDIAGNPVDIEGLREVMGGKYIILDNCIAKGTLIKTIKGDTPIENIRVGDLVLTRKGYKKVLKTMYKGVQPVIERFGVTATPDHKFITTKGKKELSVLKPSDILYSCELPTTETSIIDILNQNTGIKESIGTVGVKDADTFTAISGKINMERYQKGILSTTEMETHLTTTSKILKRLLPKNILGYTSKKMGDWKQRMKTLIKQESRLLGGINQMMGKGFTLNTINGSGLLEQQQVSSVMSVGENTNHTIQKNLNFAQGSVNQKAEVYDLTVEDAHEFFANGILVSNCDGYGTTYKGKFIDTYADLSCVSFHAAHIITMGEGGAVLTNNEELANRCKKIREWGRASGTDNIYEYPGFPKDYRERYVYEEIGYNVKPLELQCAMGRVQLKRLPEFKAKRAENFNRLMKVFKKYPQFQTVEYLAESETCWFSFPFMCREVSRERTMRMLEEANIECRTIFSGNILKHPAYEGTPRTVVGDLDNADDVMENGVFISVHPSITPKMIKWIDVVLATIVEQ